MMKFSAPVARALAIGVLLAFAGSASSQQAYPNRPIRLIVPYPPGGTVNIVARLVGQKLTESWGQPVIVDNRPGGSSIVGTEAVLKSAPDGYTIMLTSNVHVTTPLLLPTPYDALKDFAPVATVSSTPTVLVVHPSLPAANLKEFIALAKTRPGQLNYASTGNGGPTHLAGEFFAILAGVKMQHVPYKGGGPALADLIGGQVQVYFALPAPSIPYIKVGKLKAIAISGESRLPALPQVATFTEAGLPGYEVKYWQGVLAPAGVPRNIVDKLATEIGRILTVPDFREKLLSQGLDPFITTPEQFGALMKAETARFAKVIKTANVRIE